MTPSWNQTSLSAFEAVLDEFQKYDNTAGVFVGNEVLTFGWCSLLDFGLRLQLNI